MWYNFVSRIKLSSRDVPCLQFLKIKGADVVQLFAHLIPHLEIFFLQQIWTFICKSTLEHNFGTPVIILKFSKQIYKNNFRKWRLMWDKMYRDVHLIITPLFQLSSSTFTIEMTLRNSPSFSSPSRRLIALLSKRISLNKSSTPTSWLTQHGLAIHTLQMILLFAKR